MGVMGYIKPIDNEFATRCRLSFEKMRSDEGWKEGHVFFNDARNTFYLRLNGVGCMVLKKNNNKNNSERGKLQQSLHGLLFI